jgi:hypothetical protein
MTSLAIPKIEPGAGLDRDARLARLRPLPHSPESMDGIPYYDEEFAMAQSDAHRRMMYFLGSLLDRVATMAGLQSVGDYPIWYWFPEEGRQKALYPDYALTANPDIRALMATELLWTLEVVTTTHAGKEHKDTVRMRDYNALHGVPEFVLLFPEPDDPQSVRWHRYDPRAQQYERVALPADRRYRSTAIPGLEIEVLKAHEWTAERKVRVYYRGEEVRGAAEEAQMRQAAEQARQAAEQARQAAEQQVEQERQARLMTEQRAEQERYAVQQEVERLRALLREAGMEP